MKTLDEWIGRPPSGDVLFSALKRAADVIRTAVDYRVLLVFLFYKAVSDKWNAIVKENREGLTEEQAYKVANRKYMKLYDEERGALLTWDEAVKHEDAAVKIEEYLRRIAIINSSEGQGFKMGEFSDLLNQLGISALSRNQDLNPIVAELIEIFNGLDLTRADYDVLGDGYQWVLANFAPTKAKEGETYTPREVIRLMVRLMDPEDGSRVVDPACGSAAMLIEAYRHVKEKIRDNPNLLLYGQERNPAMAAIAKMNVMLHNVESDVKIYNGDSLINPMFLKENGPMDYSIANPPWNQDGYDESRLSEAGLKAIYKYGYTPRVSADWAWAQLLIYSANRKAVMVIDQGMLFRGGKEGEIRAKALKDDLVEAVIALPEKLFYNAMAPSAIVVFNKGKPAERKGKVIFIDASQEYEKHPDIRKLNRLTEEGIGKVVRAYEGFEEAEGFSRVVELKEVEEKGWSLNVSLYVSKVEEGEHIDVLKEFEELKALEEERQKVMRDVEGYVEELRRLNWDG